MNIVCLPGDGIGPEVMREAVKVLQWIEAQSDTRFDITEHPVGGAAYDLHGVPLTDQALADCHGAHAVLFGAVGGPRWEGVSYDLRPEAGLLKLRRELGLFANLRPAMVFPALSGASSLKEELISGLDILIVRELTGGIYFGEPRYVEELLDGQKRAVDTQVYTTSEIERIAHKAFQMAAKRNGHVTSVDKANVMATGRLWRETVDRIHRTDYPDIGLDHMFVDNCAMQLCRNPGQFDVIVTDNLFGDILSDEAAMLTGSLGMLPSASLGTRNALFEPVHGSAPDLAGEEKANPLAMILSVAMACRYALDLPGWADTIEQGVAAALDRGHRTADIAAASSGKILSTSAMGNAVIQEMEMIRT